MFRLRSSVALFHHSESNRKEQTMKTKIISSTALLVFCLGYASLHSADAFPGVPMDRSELAGIYGEISWGRDCYNVGDCVAGVDQGCGTAIQDPITLVWSCNSQGDSCKHCVGPDNEECKYVVFGMFGYANCQTTFPEAACCAPTLCNLTLDSSGGQCKCNGTGTVRNLQHLCIAW